MFWFTDGGQSKIVEQSLRDIVFRGQAILGYDDVLVGDARQVHAPGYAPDGQGSGETCEKDGDGQLTHAGVFWIVLDLKNRAAMIGTVRITDSNRKPSSAADTLRFEDFPLPVQRSGRGRSRSMGSDGVARHWVNADACPTPRRGAFTRALIHPFG